jgi:protocatechuate 3,4-dioxygenase beta subunit
MQRRTVAFGIALVAVAGALLWFLLQPEPASTGATPAAATAPGAVPTTAPPEPTPVTAPTQRESTPTEKPSTTPPANAPAAKPAPKGPTGTVLVRVVDDDETPQPRAGIEVTLVPLARGGLCFRSTLRSDAQGLARFEHVELGPVVVTGDRSGRAENTVRADVVTEIVLELPRGCSVDGRVVGSDGHAVSQSEVWLCNLGRVTRMAECDSNGRFHLDDLESGSQLAGVAREAVSSKLVLIEGAPGDNVAVELVVDRPGTVLLGQVLDPAEHPVAGAVVGASFLAEASYMTTATDGEGRFMIPGCSGQQFMSVRTPDFAPFFQQIECTAGVRAELIVRLKPGAILIGKTTFAGGKPAPGSIVVVGDLLDEMSGAVAVSNEQGEYRVTGLAPGVQTLRARCRNGDDVQQDLELIAGRAVVWDAVVPQPED